MKLFGLHVTTTSAYDEDILLKCFRAYNDGFKDAVRVFQDKPPLNSYLNAAKSYRPKGVRE